MPKNVIRFDLPWPPDASPLLTALPKLYIPNPERHWWSFWRPRYIANPDIPKYSDGDVTIRNPLI